MVVVKLKLERHKTKSLLTGEQEFVDYMTITSDGEISCYEIKSSINDLKIYRTTQLLGHKTFSSPHTLYLLGSKRTMVLEKLETILLPYIVLEENNSLRFT